MCRQQGADGSTMKVIELMNRTILIIPLSDLHIKTEIDSKSQTKEALDKADCARTRAPGFRSPRRRLWQQQRQNPAAEALAAGAAAARRARRAGSAPGSCSRDASAPAHVAKRVMT